MSLSCGKPRRWARRAATGMTGALLAGLLVACGQGLPPHLKPITPEAMHLLGKKGMRTSDPIFIRIFKQESELEVWKKRTDGRFYHFKTYPICNWSGALGPKFKQGDKQAPEGFYTVRRGQMNPNSEFHLSFNLGFPNAFDRAHGRTGDFLMVHGDCRSAGCYAMTDALVEEIYALAREAFDAGHEDFKVHAYPFRMTAANMVRYRRHEHYGFWTQMKLGYDSFEKHRVPPKVDVCARRYLVDARFIGAPRKVRANGACPAYTTFEPEIRPEIPAWTTTTGSSAPRSSAAERHAAAQSSPTPWATGGLASAASR